jgi:hypothetical protein
LFLLAAPERLAMKPAPRAKLGRPAKVKAAE